MEIKTKAEKMHITIDGIEVVLPGDAPSDFKSLMKFLEAEHVPPGRVVTVLRVNDEFLSGEQEIAFGARSLSDIETLEIETSPADDLAVEALMDFQDYLPRLSEQFERCAKEFRGGDQRKGFQLFSTSIEFISAFMDILDDIRKVFLIDYAKIRCGDKTMMDLNLKMHALAKEILEASEKTDWSLLADLLDYELSPLLYEWMAEIPELIKGIEERRS
jgi:hypothetical protein